MDEEEKPLLDSLPDELGSPSSEHDYPPSSFSDPRRRSYAYSLLIKATAVVLVFALALGLGLGLGLNRPRSGPSSSLGSTPSSSDDSNPSFPALQSTPRNNFVVGSIAGEAPTTRHYQFTVSKVMGAPDGVQKPMLVVNGMYPGPTIEANQGDRIIVNVTNALTDAATSIHWHGLLQNGTNYYDGTAAITECGIPPGQFLVYNFTLGEFSGTTWWHSLDAQYTDGVSGALIVHPVFAPSTSGEHSIIPGSAVTAPPPANFPTWEQGQELVVQVSDLYHDFSTELLERYLSPWGIDGTPGDEPVPDSGTLNGLGQWNNGGDYFNFPLEPNKTYRLRLINTGSFASIRFSLDYHPLTIIEVEGTLVKPYTVSSLVIAVAQRYSVLIHTNVSTSADGDVGGSFWMRSTLQRDMFTYDVPGQNVDIRGVVSYGKTDGSLPSETGDPGVPDTALGDMDTSLLVPAVPDVPPARTKSYIITVSQQKTPFGHFLAFMNTTSWEPLQGTTTLLSVRDAIANGSSYVPEGSSLRDEQFIITEDSVQVVDLIIDNLDDGEHPFHIHGFNPYIMGVGAGRYIGQSLNEVDPIRRDTFVIPGFSWMAFRFTTDNPGLWAFHCHLVWHMAAGLLMQINSLPSKAAQFDIPRQIVDQCHAP